MRHLFILCSLLTLLLCQTIPASAEEDVQRSPADDEGVGLATPTVAASPSITYPIQGVDTHTFPYTKDSTIAYPGETLDRTRMMQVHGDCVFIDNLTPTNAAYFVPARQPVEWDSFKSNRPANVTLIGGCPAAEVSDGCGSTSTVGNGRRDDSVTVEGPYTMTVSYTCEAQEPFQQGCGAWVEANREGDCIRPGLCGQSAGRPSSEAPTNGLCIDSTASAVTGNGRSWAWTCTGDEGGTTASCSAQVPVDGVCGAAEGVIVDSAPSDGLCDAGAASAVTTTDSGWNWSCAGTNGGINASCSSTLPGNPGLCGQSAGRPSSKAPTSGLCIDSTASAVIGNGTSWTWTCTGDEGGTTASCSASVPVDGVCGPADGATMDSAPADGLCNAGAASAVTTTDSGWGWSCAGVRGGINASCASVPASTPAPEYCSCTTEVSDVLHHHTYICGEPSPCSGGSGGSGDDDSNGGCGGGAGCNGNATDDDYSPY